MKLERIDKCDSCGGPIRVKVDGEIVVIESMNQWHRLSDLIKQLEISNETVKKLLLALGDK